MARTLIAWSTAVAILSICLIHSIYADTPAATTATGPDTLLQRLKQAQRVALQTDEKLSGYILYLYTPERLTKDLAALASYRDKSAELRPRIDELQQQIRRLQQQQQSDQSFELLQRLTQEHRNLQRELGQLSPPNSVILSHSLYDVIHLGEDYIELRQADNPAEQRLIPLSRIARVNLMWPEVRRQEDSTETAHDPH